MDDVWRILPLPPRTYRYVFAKAGNVVEGTWVRNAQGLQAFANRNAHANCYITLNPAGRADLIRPSGKDITHLQTILLDVDPIEPGANPKAAVGELYDILEDEYHIGQEQGYTVIDTGRGAQIWLQFYPPLPMTPDLARAVRNFITHISKRWGIRHGCVIDTSCSDPARLGRLPGTINQKTGRRTSIADPGEWLTTDFLEPFFSEPEVFCPPPPGLRTTWPQAAMFLTLTAREFIQFGVEQTRRHKACFAAAKSLLEAGVPEKIGTEWILKGSERCNPPLEAGEALRIIKRVYEA